MRFDFYQLERDGPDRVVPMLADKVLSAGKRLSIGCLDARERAGLSAALWTHGDASFLAHGPVDGPDADRQPILLGEHPSRANGATLALIADGQWRESEGGLERVLFLFRPDEVAGARDRWKQLIDADRHYWAQDEEGRWRERG